MLELQDSKKIPPISKGGFLNFLNAEWRSENNILIITKNGFEICSRQIFEFEVIYAQCYKDNNLLVYTTDYIY